MKTKLKPCPFCGGEAAESPFGTWIFCKKCGAMSEAAETFGATIRKWNRRLQPAKKGKAKR